MDFELTAEQQALAEMARDLFAKLYPPSRLRELWDGAERDPDTWRLMAEQGLVGLTVPAEHGGMGGDAIDLVVVLEEAGRAAVPDPLLETAVAVSLLAEGDAAGRRHDRLSRIATGEALAAVRIPGQRFVVDADLADVLLVAGEAGVRAAERFSWQRVGSEDRTRRLFTVEADAGEDLGGDGTRAVELGALGTAALLVGVGAKLLDLTLAHVKVRHQFGQPVGAFQAVKHKLSSVLVALESARAATRYAAYAAARDLADRRAAASVAKVQAVAAQSLANTEALQCHGGIGFTWEHDLHFWLKRGRALEPVFGTAGDHRALLASMLLD